VKQRKNLVEVVIVDPTEETYIDQRFRFHCFNLFDRFVNAALFDEQKKDASG
jgi:hypothetical protein